MEKRNGKGKEYNTEGIVIFEGEYLNGIKNGEGKEYYWNGSVIFVGQYLNGKRNGRGKEYNIKGNLIFDGEYLNGLRNGKGKEYNIKGNLIFDGEYLNGNRVKSAKKYNDNNIEKKLNNTESNLYKKEELESLGYYFLNEEENEEDNIYNNYEELLIEPKYLKENIEYNKERVSNFEGEYLYGHKLRGKYYINGKLEYEGEYLFEKNGTEKDMMKMEILYMN